MKRASKRIGKYRAHANRKDALLEAQTILATLPGGQWRASTQDINSDRSWGDAPEWMPCLTHRPTGMKMTRGSRHWFCDMPTLKVRCDRHIKAACAVRSCILNSRAAITKARSTMAVLEKEFASLKSLQPARR